MNVSNWLIEIIEGLRKNPPSDFVGMGLIVSEPGSSLPITTLVPPKAFPILPSDNPQESIEFLRSVTSRRSPFHDGFHLIDGQKPSIVGVSYFMAPPIPEATGVDQLELPIGARQMAALLGSRVEGIRLIVTMDPNMAASVFIQGARVDFDEWVNQMDLTHAR